MSATPFLTQELSQHTSGRAPAGQDCSPSEWDFPEKEMVAKDRKRQHVASGEIQEILFDKAVTGDPRGSQRARSEARASQPLLIR